MSNNHKILMTNLLSDSSVAVDLDNLTPVAGGVVSLILSVKSKDKSHKHLVIKHTYQDIKMEDGSFAGNDQDTLLDIAPKTHRLDLEILQSLQNSPKVAVPTVVWGNHINRITVMRDFRANGYTLMQDLLVTDELSLSSAKQIGKTLASLLGEMRQLGSQIKQVESPSKQADERLDELLTFLRSDIQLFREIRTRFLNGSHLIPTDGHPKNIAVESSGKIMIFDFGRSIVADPQYVAPNFAAHIGLAIIGGCFNDIHRGINYINQFIEAFNKTIDTKYKIDEKWFIRYFTAELLHRGLSGRWIDKRIFDKSSLQQVERAIHDICIEVFRPETAQKIEKISDLLQLIEDVALKVKAGVYVGKR